VAWCVITTAVPGYWDLFGHTLLGSDTVAGRAAWVLSFVTPQVPAWFTVWIDKQTHRTLELRMTAAAHFSQHRYGPFNAPLTISPPRRQPASCDQTQLHLRYRCVPQLPVCASGLRVTCRRLRHPANGRTTRTCARVPPVGCFRFPIDLDALCLTSR